MCLSLFWLWLEVSRNSDLDEGEANVDWDCILFSLESSLVECCPLTGSGYSSICIQLLLLTHNGKFKSMLPAINSQLPKLHFHCFVSPFHIRTSWWSILGLWWLILACLSQSASRSGHFICASLISLPDWKAHGGRDCRYSLIFMRGPGILV